MFTLEIISISFISVGILLLFVTIILSRKNNNVPKEKNKADNLCILIPARYESKVIKGLLDSIKNQSVKKNMNDVYVIF